MELEGYSRPTYNKLVHSTTTRTTVVGVIYKLAVVYRYSELSVESWTAVGDDQRPIEGMHYMIHGSIGQHQSAPYKSKRHLDRFSRFRRADQSPVCPTERRHTQSYVMRPKTTEQRCRLGGGLAWAQETMH